MSNDQPALSGVISSKLWQIVTHASTGQINEATLVAQLKQLLLEPATAQEPWGWIAHCAKSGGEPIIVTETIAKELSKFDDWDVFQVGRLPQSGALSSKADSHAPVADKTGQGARVITDVSGECQQAAKPCDQPQAHPARCGCVPPENTANQLLARVLEFDKSARTDQGFNLSKLVGEIEKYLQEQGQ